MRLSTCQRLSVAALLLWFAAWAPAHHHGIQGLAAPDAAAHAGQDPAGAAGSQEHEADHSNHAHRKHDCPACRVASSLALISVESILPTRDTPAAHPAPADAERPASVRVVLPFDAHAPPAV